VAGRIIRGNRGKEGGREKKEREILVIFQFMIKTFSMQKRKREHTVINNKGIKDSESSV